MAKQFEDILVIVDDSRVTRELLVSSRDPTSPEEDNSLSFSTRRRVFPAILSSVCMNEPVDLGGKQLAEVLSSAIVQVVKR